MREIRCKCDRNCFRKNILLFDYSVTELKEFIDEKISSNAEMYNFIIPFKYLILIEIHSSIFYLLLSFIISIYILIFIIIH